MSGILSVVAAAQNSIRYSVGVADLASGVIWGYNPGAGDIGTISSTAFKTTTINNVSSNTSSGDDFGIVLDGSLSQSFFSAVVVEGNNGVRYYHTSAATYSVFGSAPFLTAWSWGDGSDVVWTSAATRIMLLQC